MISMGTDSFPLWVRENDEVKTKLVTVIMVIYVLSFMVKGTNYCISIKSYLLRFELVHTTFGNICRNLLRILSPLGNLDHPKETGGSCIGPQPFLVTPLQGLSVRKESYNLIIPTLLVSVVPSYSSRLRIVSYFCRI